MILARGQLYEHSCQEEILQRMGSEIDAARTQKSLPADTVVAALDALARQIETGSFARRALALGITAQQLAQAVCMLRRESVEYRPVSYTHLDVYKRQGGRRAGRAGELCSGTAQCL